MNFAVLFLAIFTLTRFANATKKSRTCGTKNWPACALEQTEIETLNYSIVPSILYTMENNVATVKVHRTECPNQYSPILKWYRLEAFASGTNTSIGRFIEPVHSRRLETYSCHSDTAIVFDTCEPHPLDLPRQYKWIMPRQNITSGDLVCFRLTVVDDDDECEYTESCIELIPPHDDSGSGEDFMGETRFSPGGSGAYGESVNITERCLERWDCTKAKLRLFCGTDGNTYMSRCHIRLEECITDMDISIQYAGHCVDEPDPVCHTQRETLKELFDGVPEELYWLPTCDCDGLFKPIQCDRDYINEGHLDCWCSYSNSISQVAGTRRTILDTCTDPATFEFSCSSTWAAL